MALSFVLILTLITALLEAAESSVCIRYADMSLAAAAESVQGEYYGPLFEKYGLFAIDAGFGESTKDIAGLEKKLKKYVTEGYGGLKLTSLKVTETEPFVQTGLSTFILQATDQMETASVSAMGEELLKELGLLSTEAKAAKVFAKVVETERMLSVTDKYIASLMGSVDGVEARSGIALAGAKPYTLKNTFLKRFFIGEPTMENVGINNPEVYEELKELYCDPTEYLDRISVQAETCLRLKDEEDRLDRELEDIRTDILSYTDKLHENEADTAALLREAIVKEYGSLSDADSPEGEVSGEEAVKEQTEEQEKTEASTKAELLNTLKREGAELRLRLQELEEQREELERDCQTLAADMDSRKRDIEQTSIMLELMRTDALSCAETSLWTVQKAREETERLKPYVEACEKVLKTYLEELQAEKKSGKAQKTEGQQTAAEDDGEKDSDTESAVAALVRTVELMKSYVGLGDGIARYDFDVMTDTLEHDIEVLSYTEGRCCLWKDADEFTVLLGNGELSERADKIAILYGTVSYKGLVFDYSALQNVSLTEILTDSASQTLAEGVLSFLLGADAEISHARLDSELLPSLFLEQETQEQQEVYGKEAIAEDGALMWSLSGGKESTAFLQTVISGIRDVESVFSEGALPEAVTERIKEEIRNATDTLLMSGYCSSQLKCYGSSADKGDTVLDYEREYVIAGNRSDEENLTEIAGRLVLLRLVPAAVYAFSEPSVLAEAESAAALISGGIGLPLLAEAVKYLILAAVAVEQAVIETAAIMKGKKVPVLTDASSACVSVATLAAFNSTTISARAVAIGESTAAPDYGGYLLLFLLAGDADSEYARTLDIIQENLRYEFDGDILLSNFISGFTAEAEYERNVKYLTIPHLALTEEKMTGYTVTSRYEAEY